MYPTASGHLREREEAVLSVTFDVDIELLFK